MKFLSPAHELPAFETPLALFTDRGLGPNVPVITFGRNWRSKQTTVWHQLCLVRQSRDLFIQPLAGGGGSLVVLATFESEKEAFQTLAGWEKAMLDSDSISWLLERLEVIGWTQEASVSRPRGRAYSSPHHVLYG